MDPRAPPPGVSSPASQRAEEEADALESANDAEASSLSRAGQRRINLIWEVTQGVIAILVTATTLSVCVALALTDRAGEGAFLLLSNVFFLVVGTYFQRTNHTRVGGVGEKYKGR